MRSLFISDLHLDEQRPAISRAFFHFIEHQAKAADALYILGDFFESWIGDDDSSELIEQVKTALSALRPSGCQLYLMHGNRDFLIGEQFCQDVSATLLSDPTVIQLAGENTLLMHGDSLCTGDQEYLAFRQMARSAQWQQQILSKSLAERRALAKQMRMASSEANSNKAEDIMDVTPEEVLKVMTEHRCQRLIHGHTHRPARHAITVNGQNAERIVLGDWHQQGWQLECDGQHLSLDAFDIR
ncbi:UDP-2,3-diacylglucosamine diphosphatase [Spongiibacter sp.]|uniref:UDP-2,3-diacylglucosamine diphosphatase n=1 Tax=Spongiibacter sp. TaxID=2024860 RepID=UPI00356B3F9B